MHSDRRFQYVKYYTGIISHYFLVTMKRPLQNYSKIFSRFMVELIQILGTFFEKKIGKGLKASYWF